MGRPGGPGPLDPIYDVPIQYGALAFNNTPGTALLTCTINKAAGQDDPASAAPILFTAVFSRGVTGFITGDVLITGTAGASTGIVTEVAPFDGTTFQVAVSDMATDGTVVANIPAGVCVAVDDGILNGASSSTDNSVQYAISYDTDYTYPAPSGPLTWDAHYSGNAWNLLGDLGGGRWTVTAGVATFAGQNQTKDVLHSIATNRNAWAQCTNQRAFTGGTGDREWRILLNVGRDGEGLTAGASTYYYARVYQESGTPKIAIGQHTGNADAVLSSATYTVAVGDVVRFKHDGNGNLTIDVNGVPQLTGFDNVTATLPASQYLRATGVGMGGVVSSLSDVVGWSDFSAGIWGYGAPPAPLQPSPWYYADALDTDSLTSGVWTEEGPGSLSVTIVLNQSNNWKGALDSPTGVTTTWAALPSGIASTQLSADQYLEWTSKNVNSGNLWYQLLRSASSSSGYYFKVTSSGSFPFNAVVLEIGIQGGAALVTSGSYGSQINAGRWRCEAQGTTLRLKYNGVTQISVVDGTISAANQIRIGPRGTGGSPTDLFDLVVGNL